LKGEKIKLFREQLGSSQTDFAKKIGMNRSFLSQIESGEAKIPKRYVSKICEVFDVTEAKIFGSEESYPLNKEYLVYAIEIIDGIYGSSVISPSERAELVNRVYEIVRGFFAKKLSPEEMELELQNLKKESEKQERVQQEIFKIIENKLINKIKN
jgi:transcriptional regulator with XRE-family HTH domain